MSVTLTVHSEPEGESVASEAGEVVFSYPADATKVTLTVALDGDGTLPALQWRKGASSGETVSDVEDATGATYSFTPTADTDGWYTVVATPSTEVVPAGVNVQKAVAQEAPAGAPPTVAEASVGEYDAVFAAVVGVLTVAVGVVLVNRVFDASQAGDKPTRLNAAGAAQVSAASFAWALLGVATVVLLLGAAMAALETRGRLRLRTSVSHGRGLDGAGQIEALGKALNSAALLRGTVATLTAGVLLALAGAYVAGKVGAPASPTPATTPTVTSSSTSPRTATTKPSPSPSSTTSTTS